MAQYIGVIHKDADSDFGVHFPDLPGCITAGTTLEEARSFAEEALDLHLQGLIEDGEDIPAPSSLDALYEAGKIDGIAIVVATTHVTAKTVRVNISLPEDLLKEIDRHAQAEGFTRSGFLVNAAKKVLEAA